MGQSVVLASNVTLPIGVTTSKTITIPAAALARTIGISIDTTNFVQGTTCLFSIQIMLSGVWQEIMSCPFGPDIGNDISGNPLTVWTMSITPYELSIPDCQVRGVAIVGGNTFKTTITATVI